MHGIAALKLYIYLEFTVAQVTSAIITNLFLNYCIFFLSIVLKNWGLISSSVNPIIFICAVLLRVVKLQYPQANV